MSNDNETPERGEIAESVPVNSAEQFLKILADMQEDGGGLFRVMVFSPEQAAQMMVEMMMGQATNSSMYWIEIDRFLKMVRESPDDHKPLCSCGTCQNTIKDIAEVGAIVIWHGHTDTPRGALASGFCVDCWKNVCHEDRHKGIDMFTEYLSQIMEVKHVANSRDLTPETTTIN